MTLEQSNEGCKEANHVKDWMKGIVFWVENIPGKKAKIPCGSYCSHRKMGTKDLVRTTVKSIFLPGVEQVWLSFICIHTHLQGQGLTLGAVGGPGPGNALKAVCGA